MNDTESVSVALAIRSAAERLAATSDTARLDAELLMAHAFGVDRSELLVRHMQAEVPPAFAELVDRRAGHEPVAYITGRAGFYGREFAVSPAVLIPRSDSETVIDLALERVGAAPNMPGPRVLDLGTGSGALLVTVLAERPVARGAGIDASGAAIAVAQANARLLGVAERAVFDTRDWTAPGWTRDLGLFDLIVCNPPYVEQGAALERQVADHEPAAALFAGEDGLDDYRALLPQVAPLLNEGAVALFEIGTSQSQAVAALANQAGFACEIHRDLAGRPRCAVLRV